VIAFVLKYPKMNEGVAKVVKAKVELRLMSISLSLNIDVSCQPPQASGRYCIGQR
jgi:hypothetical protein